MDVVRVPESGTLGVEGTYGLKFHLKVVNTGDVIKPIKHRKVFPRRFGPLVLEPKKVVCCLKLDLSNGSFRDGLTVSVTTVPSVRSRFSTIIVIST